MDTIKFSLDCDHTTTYDFEMQRDNTPSYGQRYMTNFTYPGDYYFCWMSTYVQETANPYYNTAHDLRFRIVSVPTVDTSSVTNVNTNEHMIRFPLYGAFAEGDIL